MARLPEFETDLQVVEAMVTEQSVFCLPGKVSTHRSAAGIITSGKMGTLKCHECNKEKSFLLVIRHLRLLYLSEPEILIKGKDFHPNDIHKNQIKSRTKASANRTSNPKLALMRFVSHLSAH